MADLEIRIIAKDGATQIIRGVSSSLDGLEGSAKRAGIALANSSGKEIAFKELIGDAGTLNRTVRQTTETVSLSRGEFTALAVTGVAAFNQIMASAGQTDERISKLAQGVADIGLGFAFGGPLGAGIAALGVGINFLISEIQRANAVAAKARADLVAPFEAAKQSLDALAPSTNTFASNLQKILNLTPATAASVENLAKADAGYRDSLKQTIDQQEQVLLKEKALADARRTITPNRGGVANPAAVGAYQQRVADASASLDEVSAKAEHAASAIQIQAAAAELAANATQKAADTNAYYANQTQLAGNAALQFANDLRASADAAQANTWLDATNRRYSDLDKLLGERFPVSMQVAKDKTTDFLTTVKDTSAYEKAKAAAESLLSTLRGLVSGVMSNTSVEERLKRQGDAWDEFDLRLKAKLAGTNTAERAWGADFEKTLAAVQRATGLSMEQIQKQFESGALFANKNVLGISGIIDWGAVVGDTADAVKAIIGNFNKVSAGVQAYLNSDEGKALMPDLKMALGMDPQAAAADVQKALTGAMGGITGGADGKPSTFTTKLNFDASKAKSDAGALKTLISQIPASVAGTTVTTIQELKKAASFDNTLKTIIDDINKIPEKLDAEVTIVYRSVNPPSASGTGSNSDNHPGKASGGYVDKGLYWLGEAGREYVLPAPMVKWIESVLGGPIQDPRQLEWLFSAFGRGKDETRNQLAMWAAGVTGSMTPLPEKAEKWLDKSYDKYQATYGLDTSGTSGGGGGGGGGGAAGGGFGGDGQTLSVLQHMDGTLMRILNALGGSTGPREKPQLNSSFSSFIPLAANGFS